MTRSEAIDMAVRRHIKIGGMSALVSDITHATMHHVAVHAIRRHFAVICRQYGVNA